MRLVIEEPIIPPRQLRPDYPEDLETIVMRALERDPARRYQTARALRTDLMAWLAETGLSHDKRRIAEYLRSIFGAKKQRDADEFAGDGGDDDDLILEKALPQAEPGELQVDPEEPGDEPLHLTAPPASGEVRPIMDASTAPLAAGGMDSSRDFRDEKTAPKQRVDEEPPPLEQPPTVRLRPDDTKKTILPAAATAEVRPARGFWRRLLDFLLRR